MIDVDPTVAKHAAGPLGALSAMFFMKGPWLQRMTMLIPGAALSFYASKPLADWAHLPEGLAGFLLGLFGMAFVGKVFDTWNGLQLSQPVQRAFESLLAKLGLAKEDK